MNKRLFLAITLPRPHVEAFSSFMERSRGAFDGARWVPPGNLHLTVGFFGEVDEGKIDLMTDTLKKTLSKQTVFPLVFESIAFAPPRRPPTMIWARYASNADLDRLVRDVNESLRDIIDERPSHPHLPHVTLARFDEPVTIVSLSQPAALEPFAAGACTLFESRPALSGPSYAALAEIPLGAGIAV